MTLKEIVDAIGLTVCGSGEGLSQEVSGGYASDLLSDVIARSKAGEVWVTMQVHVNIIAVAVLKDLPAIILVNGRQPADDTLQKAAEEHVTLLVSPHSAFATVGKLYSLGIGKIP